MNFELKRAFFYTFSTILIAGQVAFGYWIFYLLHSIHASNFFLYWVCPIVLGIIIFILSFILTAVTLTFGTKDHTVNMGMMLLHLLDDRKKIYHSELGYFVLTLYGTSAMLYQQNFFTLTHIKSFTIDTPENLSKSIKKELDYIYNEKLRQIKAEKESFDKIDKIKKWDGFLDKQGKRDNKLNQLGI